MPASNILILLLSLIHCFFSLEAVNGGDTLFVNQTLSSNNTLVSKRGIFELGFFKPGSSLKEYVGVCGYMSPEYAIDGLFSIKSDVFSFGVLVLEIISGRGNRGFYHPDDHLNLLGHTWKLFNEERSLEIVNQNLTTSYSIDEVMRTIHIGLLCVQESPQDRPNMGSVVLMLSSDSKLTPPKAPGFFTARKLVESSDTSSSSHQLPSTNGMSVTMIVPR